MSAWVWVDGRVQGPDEAAFRGSDPGALFGHGVYDTTRIVRDEPFAMTRHLRRLRRSAALAEVPVPWSDAELRAACESLVGTAPPVPDGHLGRLRLTVTAGASSPALLLTHVPEWPATSTVVVVDRAIDAADPLRGAKVVSRLAETLALAEARRRGADEALRFTRAGLLAEGSASNVFLVLDGQVVTPSLGTGCLPGITRELVLELIDVDERDDLDADDLARADEVFLTSGTRNVHPVGSLDGRTLDAPGPRTAAIADVYRDLQARTLDPEALGQRWYRKLPHLRRNRRHQLPHQNDATRPNATNSNRTSDLSDSLRCAASCRSAFPARRSERGRRAFPLKDRRGVRLHTLRRSRIERSALARRAGVRCDWGAGLRTWW